MKKKTMTRPKKAQKLIHEALVEGHAPKEVVMIEWEDITQSEHCNLGENIDLVTLHSIGVIINMDKNKVDLQQTWAFHREEANSLPTNPANILLSLPPGVIKKIYKYKLIKDK